MKFIRAVGARCLEWGRRLKAQLDAFMFGAAMSWVMVPYVLRRRQELERLFAVITSSAMMGLPLMPGGSELKLLPHMIPNLLYWRRMTGFSRELDGVDLKHIGH